MQYLGTIHCVQRHWDVEIEVSRLRIIHAHSIEENERFLKRGAANGQVSLHAIGAAFLQIERRVETQNFRQRPKKQRLLLRVEHNHRAIGAGERQRI